MLRTPFATRAVVHCRALRKLFVFCAVVAAPVSWLCCGCSVMKIKMPGEPLSRKDQNIRQQTREFASSFSAAVQAAADQIAKQTNDGKARDDAVQWKVSASSAMRRAALRTAPVLALVDAWALTEQMAHFFQDGPGESAFAAQHEIALTNALALAHTVGDVAHRLLTDAEFKKASEFVANYSEVFPLRDLSFDREPVAAQWIAFRGGDLVRTIGTTPDVISDLADRVKVVSEQVPDELRWRLEKPLGEVESTLTEIRRTLGAFDSSLQQLTTASETGPLVVSNAVHELRTGFLPVLERFDKQWASTVTTFKEEREALTRNVSTERAAVTASLDKAVASVLQTLEKQMEALLKSLEKERAAVMVTLERERGAVMQDVDRIVRETTERSWQNVRAMVSEILIYLVVLALIVLGLPFFFGYLVGRSSIRSSERERERGSA